MPSTVDTYQALREQYNQLPWYKKIGFWLSAPRLAWGLFGYKQSPNEVRTEQLIALAKSAWFYATEFERKIIEFFSPRFLPITSSLTASALTSNAERDKKSSIDFGINNALFGFALTYLPRDAKGGHALIEDIPGVKDSAQYREFKVPQLLLAVAYGMESKSANTSIKPEDAHGLFEHDVFVEDLIKNNPGLLLERGKITDWEGRTFLGRNDACHDKDEGISAWELMVYNKDFKMMALAVKSLNEADIPEEERERIRVVLLEQEKQVKTPTEKGGGLTYTHTYPCPNLDAAGIPDGTTTTVTEKHTENHFDLTPYFSAFQVYGTNYKEAYWTKFIGMLQRYFLPVHILQRYCDPDTRFFPLEEGHFTGAFKRSMDFYNWVTRVDSSLFGSHLSSDFALYRGWRGRTRGSGGRGCAGVDADLAAVRHLDKVSTIEMEKIIQQLSQPQRSAGLCP